MIKKGIYAASLSILNDNLSLNIEATISHAASSISKGLHGVFFFGSTGQSQLISISEKKEFISRIASHKLRKQFFLGTGCNSLKENIDLIKYAMEYGFNDFLIMPPAYYKYGDKEVIEFYSKIAEAIPESEIILYNFEKLCGYKFSIECVEKLVSKYPNNIVGVKDSSYNLFENLKINNFSVLPGSESKLLKGLQLGCSGIITATCNATSELARKVYDDFQNGNEQKANQKLCDVRSAFEKYNLISGLHTYFGKNNSSYKNLLPPLSILNSGEAEELNTNLEKLNFSTESSQAA